MKCGCGECRACGSGIVSSAADMLSINVVRGMRGVGGVYKICVARDSVDG